MYTTTLLHRVATCYIFNSLFIAGAAGALLIAERNKPTPTGCCIVQQAWQAMVSRCPYHYPADHYRQYHCYPKAWFYLFIITLLILYIVYPAFAHEHWHKRAKKMRKSTIPMSGATISIINTFVLYLLK